MASQHRAEAMASRHRAEYALASGFNDLTEHYQRLGMWENSERLSRQAIEEAIASSMKRVFSQLKVIDEADYSQENVLRPWLAPMSPFPPSTSPLQDLEPIRLNDLGISKNHFQHVAVLRTFTPPDFNRYLCAGVEDAEGGVDFIVLFNTDPFLTIQQILPQGLVVAVKAPFYTTFPNGKHGIMVENPSDLIELDLASPLMPPKWKQDLLSSRPNAVLWKTHGNGALVQRDFMTAARCYTMGVSICGPDEIEVRRQLLRNRASANFKLGRFQQSRDDALACFVPGNDTMKSANIKALHRAALASVELQQYNKVQEFMQKALALGGSQPDQVVTGELELNQARLYQTQTGDYDFDAIGEFIQRGSARVDVASFVANTEVQDLDNGKGRSLIATKDIAIGRLVLCEKAFCASFLHDTPEPLHTNWVHSSLTKQGFCDATARLLPMGAHSAEDVDGRSVLYSLKGQRAIEVNGFSLPALTTGDTNLSLLRQHESDPDLETDNAGLFPQASMVNHACNGDTIRSFMGDLILLRATRDIRKGEEITMAYVPRDDSYAAFQLMGCMKRHF
ncbi:Uu.00g105850.m01.CDS01 [Anthostomella pinea]|uniref:Uu.00g105850.m01.CDS01 n=1 Tax=Anthostomella pinea TaxID=933095 RepID=A0AAI8YDF0_9PEZI|nr:Uu.00g105850.m01.CDS01 [Anthostomella pinea]